MNIIFKKYLRKSLLAVSVIGLSSLIVACSQTSQSLDEEYAMDSDTEVFEYEVRSGDTLGGIASWYTGSVHNWEKLAALNPDIRPEKMNVGEVVRIPESLLVRRDLPQVRKVSIKRLRSKNKKNPNDAEIRSVAENAAAELEDVAAVEPDLSQDQQKQSVGAVKADSDSEVQALLRELEETNENTEPTLTPKTQNSVPKTEREKLLDELLAK